MRIRQPHPASTSRQRRQAWEALLFLSPWIIGFVVFTAGPIVWSLGLSFFKWDIIREAHFVGLANYRQMLHDRLLAKSLWNTTIYAILFIPLGVGTALGLA